MAAKAGVECLFGTNLGEGNDSFLATAGVDVRFPRAMTAFAARILRRFGSTGDASVMWITKELVPDGRVASFTRFAANVVGASRKNSP